MNHITGTIKELCEAFIASKILDCMMRGKLLRHHMLSLSIDKGNTQQILAILSIFLRKTFFVKTNYIRNRKSFSKSFLPMNRKKFWISFYNCPTSGNRITVLNDSHYQTLPY